MNLAGHPAAVTVYIKCRWGVYAGMITWKAHSEVPVFDAEMGEVDSASPLWTVKALHSVSFNRHDFIFYDNLMINIFSLNT